MRRRQRAVAEGDRRAPVRFPRERVDDQPRVALGGELRKRGDVPSPPSNQLQPLDGPLVDPQVVREESLDVVRERLPRVPVQDHPPPTQRRVDVDAAGNPRRAPRPALLAPGPRRRLIGGGPASSFVARPSRPPPFGALRGDSTSTSPSRRSRPAPRPGRVAAPRLRGSPAARRPAVHRGVRLVRRVPARGFALARSSSLGRPPRGHGRRVRRRRRGPGSSTDAPPVLVRRGVAVGERARRRGGGTRAGAGTRGGGARVVALVLGRARGSVVVVVDDDGDVRSGRRRGGIAPRRRRCAADGSLAARATPPRLLLLLAPLELRHLRGLHDVRDDA